jgi:phosphoribosylformimino-5-aminoimidazole carboxamide ribotide isomerase
MLFCPQNCLLLLKNTNTPKMRIIPAIDIIDGKCVRLSGGDYATRKTYYSSPVEVAKVFENQGIKYLHLVDLDGAKAKRIVNLKTLEAIANTTSLQIDFGGGITTKNDVESIFSAGAQQVTAGSLAVKQPELFEELLQTFGSQRIILGADCKNRKIAASAWAEVTDFDVVDFITHNEAKGALYSIVTDISKDGMLLGAAVDLYAEILAKTNIRLIASGGITTIDDLKQLRDIGCEGAIIGKAIYEKTIDLQQLMNDASAH